MESVTELFSQLAFELLKLELLRGCQVSSSHLPEITSWDNPSEAAPTGAELRGALENH